MNLFDVLFAKKLSGGGSPFPPVIKRVTGNPIEFTDGADAPLVKCVTQITGSQDLHGYDKPWVGGAGKNKLPLVLADIKNANTTGTWSGNTYTDTGVIFKVLTDSASNVIGISVKANSATTTVSFILSESFVLEQSCIMNGCPQGGGVDKYVLNWQTNANDTGEGIYITTPTVGNVRIQVMSGASLDDIFYPMIRLSTVTDSTFAPYSNICPITAYTEGEIEVRGKNLYNPATETGTSSSKENEMTVEPNTDYVFSVNVTQSGLYVYGYRSGSRVEIGKSYGTRRCSFNSGEYTKIRVTTYSSSLSLPTQLQVEKGTTPTTYEPYTSTTNTTTYPSAIYRGSEDVVNGTVGAGSDGEEWVKVTFDGSNDELWYLSEGSRFYIDDSSLGAKPHSVAISNQYENHVVDYWSALQNGEFSIHPSTGNIISFVNTNISSVSDWRTYLASNNLEVAYQLQTPTTSSVTPTNLPIKSLSGYNHIESSTGDMTIDYITDAYQNFVDTTERAIPSTRKGGVKAFDIFKTLDEPKKPEVSAEESKPEEKETEEGAKK